ncbi:hypothetical protein CsSME_00036794 [Camellia sinensis var. sinensis]
MKTPYFFAFVKQCSLPSPYLNRHNSICGGGGQS